MTSCAYSKMYLDDAQENLGNMFDYAINDCGFSPEETTEIFLSSGISEYVAAGHPRFVAGMSGTELFRCCMRKLGREEEAKQPHTMRGAATPEFWAGWICAYYQWHRGLSFQELFQVLPFSEILRRYILHEAPIEKSVKVFDEVFRDEELP